MYVLMSIYIRDGGAPGGEQLPLGMTIVMLYVYEACCLLIGQPCRYESGSDEANKSLRSHVSGEVSSSRHARVQSKKEGATAVYSVALVPGVYL